ncbi:MAG TPA: hypothetical protein VGJ92_12675 [Methanocella sp.]|jgi:hypothetical protein
MKVKLLLAGTILAALVLCIVAATAVSLQSQMPGQSAATDIQVADATGGNDEVAQSPVPETVSPVPQPDTLLPAVSGRVIDTYGNGLGGETIMLHLMGYNYTDGQVSGVWEAGSLTATTDTSQPTAGEYRFSGVALTSGVKYGYVSVTKQIPGGVTIYGYGLNFTLEDDSSIMASIVLHLSP